jgi:hypothetical protein
VGDRIDRDLEAVLKKVDPRFEAKGTGSRLGVRGRKGYFCVCSLTEVDAWPGFEVVEDWD